MLKRWVQLLQELPETRLFSDQEDAMQHSPDDKIPCWTMPEATKEKGYSSPDQVDQLVGTDPHVALFWQLS